MLSKRIIPCLDVKDGRVVKGVNFLNLLDAGNPVELAKKYYDQGADELTFLDISASQEKRGSLIEMVEKVADQIFIPFTVGGGVRNVDDVSTLLKAGADKVGINSAAISDPNIINSIADRFGKQVIVISIDAKRSSSVPCGFTVTTHGGKKETGIDAVEWLREVEKRGAGEILLNSMDKDGTTSGFDIELTKLIRNNTDLPLIASGGAGEIADFVEIIEQADVDAVLAASVFHYAKFSIYDVKNALKNSQIQTRL